MIFSHKILLHYAYMTGERIPTRATQHEIVNTDVYNQLLEAQMRRIDTVDFSHTSEIVNHARNLRVFVEKAEEELGTFAQAVCRARSASGDKNYSTLVRTLLRIPSATTLRRALSAREQELFHERNLATLRDARLKALDGLSALAHRMTPEDIQNFIRSWNISTLPAVPSFFDTILGVEGPVGVVDIPWSQIHRDRDEQRQYEPTHYEVLRHVTTMLPVLTPLRLVDIGSGYGRAAMYLALSRPNLSVQGIELIGTRVEKATDAAQRFPGVDVTFTQGSASDEQLLPNADVYYFFNPVSKETMDNIIALLERKRADGHVFEVISYGISHDYFEARHDLFDLLEFTDTHGMRLSRYASKPQSRTEGD